MYIYIVDIIKQNNSIFQYWMIHQAIEPIPR